MQKYGNEPMEFGEHFMDDNTGLICGCCFRAKSTAYNIATALTSGYDQPLIEDDYWTDDTSTFFTCTGSVVQDGIKLRSPRWYMDTRFVAMMNLLYLGDGGFTGFPISANDNGDDDVNPYGLRLWQDGDDIVVRGYFEFKNYGEHRLTGAMDRIKKHFENGAQNRDLADMDDFMWVSEHLCKLAKAVDKAAGFWGNNEATAWSEGEVYHPSSEDLLLIIKRGEETFERLGGGCYEEDDS